MVTHAKIQVQVDEVAGRISPYLVGACIEDVNHEIYGGLYSQLLFGESFEEEPLMIDEVSYRFPQLRIIETHMGWPWIGEALIVARKNKNVFCDFSGLVPHIHIGNLDHTANVGSYRLAEIQLPDKLLFGSDAPHCSPKAIINMVRDLPVAEEVKKKWLGENAVSFLDLGY